jgi:hypothetical protein
MKTFNGYLPSTVGFSFLEQELKQIMARFLSDVYESEVDLDFDYDEANIQKILLYVDESVYDYGRFGFDPTDEFILFSQILGAPVTQYTVKHPSKKEPVIDIFVQNN